MPATDPELTLAQLVIARPELASPLDRLGLDYCCGGQRTLLAAMTEAELDPTEVLAELDRVEPGAGDREDEWDGLDGLVDHLQSTHHDYLHRELPRLVALADKVATVHGDRHPELGAVAALVHRVQADLEPHLLKEERVLFPMIRELATATTRPTFGCGSLANPISVMLVEHDTAGEFLARLRSETGDFTVPEDGCASYRALYEGLAELESDTHRHVHKENNILFPAVVEAERALADR